MTDRAVSPEYQAALESGVLFLRDFLSIWPRNRETGAEVFCGFWSDFPGISADVVDPDNGVETRAFAGVGSALVRISDIVAVAATQVQEVTIRFSQIHDAVTQAVRVYEPRQCRVQIHRGLFYTGGRQLVAPAECRFFGFCDGLEIITPKVGEVGYAEMTALSHTQEITRANPDTRSHESQILRHEGDNFMRYSAGVKDWEFWWGREGGPLDTKDSTGNSGSNPSQPWSDPRGPTGGGGR